MRSPPIIKMDLSYIKIGSNHNGTQYSLAITKIPTGKNSGNLRILHFNVFIVVSKVPELIGSTSDPELTTGSKIFFVTKSLSVFQSYTFLVQPVN